MEDVIMTVLSLIGFTWIASSYEYYLISLALCFLTLMILGATYLSERV